MPGHFSAAVGKISPHSSSLGRTDQRPVGRTRTEEIKPTLIKRLKLFSYFSSYKPFQLKVLIYSSINFPQPAELA